MAVLFETVAAGGSFSDAARMAARHANGESDLVPAHIFFAKLAKVGGGRLIESVADAVTVYSKAAAAQVQESGRSWSQSVGKRSPWCTASVPLLRAEWGFAAAGQSMRRSPL